MATTFTGTPLKLDARRSAGARSSLHVRAGLADLIPKPGIDRPLSKRDSNTLKRGKEGQVKKAGKLLPKKEGWLDNFKPKQAQTFSAARNAPREKGFGGGGAWMKIDPKTPGFRGITNTIDPLVYTGGLIAVFVGAALVLTAS